MHIALKESHVTELARCIAKAIVDEDESRYEKYMKEARPIMRDMSKAELLDFINKVQEWSGN